MKNEFKQQFFTGERALFKSKDLLIVDSIFDDGESPLKESEDIEIVKSVFKYKYPLWYCKNIITDKTNWLEMARSGVWYSNNIKVSNCIIEAPKNFRRSNDIELNNVFFANASETLWNCKNIKMNNVHAKGDYFGMNSSEIEIDNLTLDGNYFVDGGKNIVIRNSRLLSKDAFWNCENVTVFDSYIIGEYLGWNSKNLTFINCTIESLQGLCYIQNLVMKNCKLINTTLAFEYSTVDAEIDSSIDSVMNPSGGIIKADYIKDLIIEQDKVDPEKITIIVKNEEPLE
jgi:hypothetical protein